VVAEGVDAGWINAYVANAYELVSRSGPAALGEWHTMADGDQTGALVEG
jgi:hypothetical protein